MSETATDVKIKHLEGEVAELKVACADLRKELRGARDFQIWITGALAAVTFFCGLFATEIKKAFS